PSSPSLHSCAAHHPDLHSFPTRRSSDLPGTGRPHHRRDRGSGQLRHSRVGGDGGGTKTALRGRHPGPQLHPRTPRSREQRGAVTDRKSTRLNSSHVKISYAVFCLKKKNK